MHGIWIFRGVGARHRAILLAQFASEQKALAAMPSFADAFGVMASSLGWTPNTQAVEVIVGADGCVQSIWPDLPADLTDAPGWEPPEGHGFEAEARCPRPPLVKPEPQEGERLIRIEDCYGLDAGYEGEILGLVVLSLAAFGEN